MYLHHAQLLNTFDQPMSRDGIICAEFAWMARPRVMTQSHVSAL